MGLVLFFIGSKSFVKFVGGLVKFNLKSVNLFSIISDIAISLVSYPVGLFCGLLELVDDGVELIGLVLAGLHLLPDGVHGCCCGGGGLWRGERRATVLRSR